MSLKKQVKRLKKRIQGLEAILSHMLGIDIHGDTASQTVSASVPPPEPPANQES
jgi:hypothetical protein